MSSEESVDKTQQSDWDSQLHDAGDLIHTALLRWGGDAQMAKAAEEFSELAAECSRDLNRQADAQRLLEELVDARIMIEQLAYNITDEALETTVDDKLDNLEDRLSVADTTEVMD